MKTLSAILLAAVLLGGCSKSEPTVIRVATFLGDRVLIKIENGIIADIEKRNPGLKIRLEIIPYNNYQEKITS